ncbi:Fur family transcriptional regulator [Romboutsia lituseburensis]|uniref:Fe2+ or Zn2+ uptake regulation protein n=1 Tax=Romboutsia lituseburensis DSM 797 TaxID=1121325 RepID=A0A1G9SEF7_9FIRM|nr:transcriptional repressor [Romboutsia lituseburensis]CEH35911.1 Ferric uptake regulation protein FUR [Romboutsia lituseburensis]SDM33185.1 Fe2+ or Zn2+ uptake regulation protein [Romboutsia lituseburensis DSM 797]
MDKNLIHLRNIIESNGYKFTKQKQYILKVLINAKSHLSAEDIYQIVRVDSVGIATVYRTLKKLKELNIVKEINIDGTNFYEMKIFGGRPLHIHFKCNECNSIMDIYNRSLILDYLKLNNNAEKENNFTVFDADIMLIGLCSECREKKICQDQLNLEE